MEWTKHRLEELIRDGIQEGHQLDYKRAAALSKSDERKKTEITKDVSSFANASGGVIIYGMRELDGYLPESLDPVDRSIISREWLEHIIQGIEPRITGIKIHPVPLDESGNHVCYVVEIPESDTAHQAKDGRYYRRYNFEAQIMHDRDIRDVMGRRRVPLLEVSVWVRPVGFNGQSHGVISVQLKNVGRVMARSVLVTMEVPLAFGGGGENVTGLDELETGEVFLYVNLAIGVNDPPLFPGDTRYLKHKYQTSPDTAWNRRDGKPVRSVRDIKLTVFADDMPKIGGTFEPRSALNQWLKIG